RPEVWWTLPWKVPVSRVVTLLSFFALSCALAEGCAPKASVSKTNPSASLILGSIALSPLRSPSLEHPEALWSLAQAGCQRGKAHAKKENSTQIILAFEVCEEESPGSLEPYLPDPSRLSVTDGFSSDPPSRVAC